MIVGLILGTIPCLGSAEPLSLETLSAAHPRLLFSSRDFATARTAIATNDDLSKQLKISRDAGELLLSEKPDSYQLGGQEHTLMAVSREMEGRILLLAGLYQLTGELKFATRAKAEMLSAASFPDWYPRHFLDTAEMTTAMGVGYDWLYGTLSDSERRTIHDAIVAKGLEPWLALQDSHGFHNDGNNWVQVCYGGEAVGALAVAESNLPEDMARARKVLGYAQPAMIRIMKLFAPDGGFEEGPVYWNYATTYNVLYIAALDSALGSDFGLSEAPGFSETASYRIQSIGPLFRYANFGDAEPEAFPAPEMYWFAKRFRKLGFAVQERRLSAALMGHMTEESSRESSRFGMLGLLWESLLPSKLEAPIPTETLGSFHRVAQAYMRSGWDDPNAWFVGFKGGDAHASHGHLDLGSFVLDAFGHRWAEDLGKDDYGLPGYFKQQRWSYYRLGTEGHNTLTIDGQNEDLDATAPLSQTGANVGSLYATANLDRVYKGKLKSWERGVSLLNSGGVLVQDEVAPALPVDIVWNLHTTAVVRIAPDRHAAILLQNGVKLDVRILSPTNGKFTLRNSQVLAPQASNRGISNLVIDLPKQASPIMISVLFSGVGKKARAPLIPITAWNTSDFQEKGQ
jgi:hypothetical protein